MKVVCMQKSDEILGAKDQETLQIELLEGVGLSLEQLFDESKIETATPTCKMFVAGKPMNEELQFDQATQTRRFHKWYLEQSEVGREL
jgi:hypothetical protein